MTPTLTYLDAGMLVVVASAIAFMAGRLLNKRSIEREVRAQIEVESGVPFTDGHPPHDYVPTQQDRRFH